MPNTNTNTKKIIYSMRIFLTLQEQGFYPIATMPNPRNPQLICWIYERSDAFDVAFEKLMGEGDK